MGCRAGLKTGKGKAGGEESTIQTETNCHAAVWPPRTVSGEGREKECEMGREHVGQ